MSVALILDDVSIALGGRPVLRDVSLSAHAGELLALVGPNGAGKTTLLRAIVGLVATGGAIRIGGDVLTALALDERARRVAYLPQGHVVHWPLPVRDVVALGRYAHGARDPDRLKPADAAAVERAMALADVARLADRAVTQLSGGERSRVALARVLAAEAPLLLADEPTASLDPNHQLTIMSVLRQVADAGALVIVVTHDLGLAARFADGVAVLSGGRLVADGAPPIALSDALIQSVFGVRAYRSVNDGEALLVPWAPA